MDYVKQIKPLFEARCTRCHGALKQKSGLRLDASPLVLKGGKHGAILIPGKASQSKLIDAITGETAHMRMPEDGDPLMPAEIALIRGWIDEGAKSPDEPIPSGPESHWSFKQPVRPAVPQVKNATWVRNPVDAFVAAEHEARGLSPRAEAEKSVLLRRVTLDLTGIPPTRDELHAFLADTSSDAYEKVVDRLLASPRYGESWGRHWMDVWRYSDWAGYDTEVRFSRPHIWRWRDWIIESLNADKPYDQMVREMLAGDEIAPADPQVVRATGFLARNWSLYNRVGWMDEAVEHTSKAFLGLTFNCAKCHDHMFDPVSQREYFQYRSIFETYDVRVDPVPGIIDTNASGIVRVVDGDEKRPTYLFIRGDDRNPNKDELMTPTVPASLGGKYEVAKIDLPPAGYYNGLKDYVRKDLLAAADTAVAAAEKTLAEKEKYQGRVQTTYAALAAPPKPAATQPATSPVFLTDTFAAARPEVWQTGPGPWQFKDGKLIQSAPGATFKHLRSLAQHPQDFSAQLTFKITGGEQFHSVGFSFDANDTGDEQAVYLTAHKASAGALIFYLHAGAPVYEGAGRVALQVKLNEPYELRAEIRSPLVNVYVNDKLVMAYTLRKVRQPGKFAIWTYDATAEFTAVQVEAPAQTSSWWRKSRACRRTSPHSIPSNGSSKRRPRCGSQTKLSHSSGSN